MLSKAINGFTSTEVDDVIRGVYGPPTYRYRAELCDREGVKIRDITGALDMARSRIVHNAAATDIRRSAEVVFRETSVELDAWATLVNSTAPLFFLRTGEPSGTTMQDASGNGRTGTYHGGFTLGQPSLVASDTSDSAVKLNGTTGYGDMADAAFMDVTRISIAGLIKGSQKSVIQYLMFRSGVFALYGNATTGYLAADLVASGAVQYVSTADVLDGNPHFCVLTYDGSFVRLYVDGFRVLKTAASGNVISAATAIFFGANSGLTVFVNGTLDELIMWGRALTEAEVRSLSQSALNDFRQVYFDRDYVKVYGAVRMFENGTDGTPYAEWPVFMGKLSSPSRAALETGGIERPCQLHGLESILQNDSFTSHHLVAAGVNYITGANGILAIAQVAGFDTSAWSIEATTKTTPASVDFEIGTTRLQAINTLLEAINYHPLRFSATGQGIIKAYTLPDERAVEDTLTAQQGGMISDAREERIDIDQVDNKVIITRADPDLTTLQAEASNSAVTSSTGTALTGRTRTFVKETKAVDQTTLNALAQRNIALAANRATRVLFSTPHRPFHDDEDIITVVDTTAENALGLSANYIQEEWTLPLMPTQAMTHVLRRIQNI